MKAYLFLFMEIWKDIIGYEGIYKISNKGNVKSLERYVNHSGGSFSLIKERIMKQGTSTSGYKQSLLSKEAVKRMFMIHRLVALHFIPNPDNKKEVNHIDGNKWNNNDWNLEWNTPKENQTHSMNALLNCRKGENHGFSKLTAQQVLEIRSSHLTRKELSTIYNTDVANISYVINRKTWKHI